MKNKCKMSLMLGMLLLFSNHANAILIENFAVTSQAYSWSENMDQAVQNELGSDYQLADWSQILQYFNEGNDVTAFTNLVGVSRLWVSLYDTEFYTSNRHYFINFSNHSTPSGFLVHQHIDNHLIDLGSWWNSRPILAYTSSTTRNGVPEPATILLMFIGLLAASVFKSKCINES